MTSTMIRTYSDTMRLSTFDERFRYLKLDGVVGEFTFNGHRILNQILYQSKEWKRTRREVIIRDNGCDLACTDRPLFNSIVIHHINPITIDDILERNPIVFDLENLICVSGYTHNDLHYGNDNNLPKIITERTKYDTCPWRN